MRLPLLAAIVLSPAPLMAQYPEAGRYAVAGSPPGSEQTFALLLEVKAVGDSVALIFGQEGQDPIPLADQGLLADGFYFQFGNTRCPFVKVDGRWEAVCANLWDVPQFVMTITGKAEPDPT